jgi:predicted N-acyltransferase
MLYRIRRAEKLAGEVDFVMIKDIKGSRLKDSEVVERYSYRRIKTDPDMVLELDRKLGTFKDYLEALNTKYRSKARKFIKTVEEGGYAAESAKVDAAMDRALHALYMEVERKSATRMATLPKGYFKGLADALGDDFACKVLRKGDEVAGFISILRDGDEAIAYYVGFKYSLNEKFPLYFRLLQLVIEQALEWKCKKVSFGRTALEPKAGLGAKPVECHVWVRHRVSAVNWAIRKLFRNVPFEEAPERSAFKEASKDGL